MGPKQWTVLVLAMLAAVSTARADTLLLKSGDRLSGTIEVSDAKDVTLKTDFAGEIEEVHWTSIQDVKSDQSVYVVMPDKSTAHGVLSTDGANLVVHPANGAAVQLPMAAVTAVRSSDQETAYEKTLHPSLLENWKGGVNIGFALARGNSETTNSTPDLPRTARPSTTRSLCTSLRCIPPTTFRAAALPRIPLSAERNTTATLPAVFSHS